MFDHLRGLAALACLTAAINWGLGPQIFAAEDPNAAGAENSVQNSPKHGALSAEAGAQPDKELLAQVGNTTKEIPAATGAALKPEAQWGQVSAANLFMRSGPGTQNVVLATLHDGDLVKTKTLKDGWLEIEWPRKVPAWIAKESIRADATGHAGLATAENAYVRCQNTPHGAVVAKLPKGTPVTIRGETGGWYKIEAPASATGFIGAKYVLLGVQPPPATVTTAAPVPAAKPAQAEPADTRRAEKSSTVSPPLETKEKLRATIEETRRALRETTPPELHEMPAPAADTTSPGSSAPAKPPAPVEELQQDPAVKTQPAPKTAPADSDDRTDLRLPLPMLPWAPQLCETVMFIQPPGVNLPGFRHGFVELFNLYQQAWPRPNVLADTLGSMLDAGQPPLEESRTPAGLSGSGPSLAGRQAPAPAGPDQPKEASLVSGAVQDSAPVPVKDTDGTPAQTLCDGLPIPSGAPPAAYRLQTYPGTQACSTQTRGTLITADGTLEGRGVTPAKDAAYALVRSGVTLYYLIGRGTLDLDALSGRHVTIVGIPLATTSSATTCVLEVNSITARD